MNYHMSSAFKATHEVAKTPAISVHEDATYRLNHQGCYVVASVCWLVIYVSVWARLVKK